MNLDSLYNNCDSVPPPADTYPRLLDTPCLVWRGDRLGRYGVVPSPWDRRSEFVHRLAWRFSGRTLCSGTNLDHVCGNSLCINPDHLDRVTPSENQLRKARRKPTVQSQARVFKDAVRTFIAETCDLDPAFSVLRSALFARWQLWARERGLDPRADAAFGRALRWVIDQPCQPPRHRVQGQQKRYYYGLTLKGETRFDAKILILSNLAMSAFPSQ